MLVTASDSVAPFLKIHLIRRCHAGITASDSRHARSCARVAYVSPEIMPKGGTGHCNHIGGSGPVRATAALEASLRVLLGAGLVISYK